MIRITRHYIFAMNVASVILPARALVALQLDIVDRNLEEVADTAELDKARGFAMEGWHLYNEQIR